MNENLTGKKVKFHWINWLGENVATGIVIEHIVEENCLTVRHQKLGDSYISINQIEKVF